MQRSTMVLFAALFVGACAVPVGDEDLDGEEEEGYVDPGMQEGDSKMDGAASVQAYVTGTCSTTVVRGLSLQIAEEIRCLAPDMLVPLNPTSTMTFQSGAVLPYIAAETADALRDAARTEALQLNSGLRSVAQQYLLKKWQRAGRCGISAAASPGRSNHETGRAVDLGNSAAARAEMRSEGFTTLRNDPPLFDHLASPDLRSVNVEAFQRLWNRNHPEDMISDDGIFGPQTEARLARAPSGGFQMGANCGL
jgi:hypothetical protein